MQHTIVVHTDGGADSEKRIAAIGFVAIENGRIILHAGKRARFLKGGKRIRRMTAERAEWAAIQYALASLQEHLGIEEASVTCVDIHSDALTMVEQLESGMIPPHLRSIHDAIRKAREGFREVSFEWVPREENGFADGEVKKAMRGEHVRRRSIRPAFL